MPWRIIIQNVDDMGLMTTGTTTTLEKWINRLVTVGLALIEFVRYAIAHWGTQILGQ